VYLQRTGQAFDPLSASHGRSPHQALERERAQSLATRDRVTDLTEAVEAKAPLARLTGEVSARKEAVEELVRRVGAAELQAQQDKSAADEAMAACLAEMGSKVTTSQVAVRCCPECRLRVSVREPCSRVSSPSCHRGLRFQQACVSTVPGA